MCDSHAVNFIYPYLPKTIRYLLEYAVKSMKESIIEIRLRAEKPLLIVLATQDCFLDAHGNMTKQVEIAYCCSADDLQKFVQAICKNSIYALEQELKNGYITIEGGYRIGIAGQAIFHEDKFVALKNISAVNIRIAHEIKVCAKKVISYITHKDEILNTLLISPPRCGKTTLLRDIVRYISDETIRFPRIQVGIVDERSEIAACRQGIPRLDVGIRSDVLDGCSKSVGMMMLLRTMAPTLIVTDELGTKEDVLALNEALQCGVSILTTVHGRNLSDVMARPYIKKLILEKYFSRYIFLTNSPQIGTIQAIYDVNQDIYLYEKEKNSC